MSHPINELRNIISYHHKNVQADPFIMDRLRSWYDKYVHEVNATYSFPYGDEELLKNNFSYIRDILLKNLASEIGKVLEPQIDRSHPFQVTWLLKANLIIDKNADG